jgi:LEA14-like dessication related protein
MKKPIMLIIALSTLIMIAGVSAFGGAIAPPKLDIQINASHGLPQEAHSTIVVKNPNEFPVNINITTTGDLNTSKIDVKFSKNNFTLKPGETEMVDISFNVKEHRTYRGDILTRFELMDYAENRSNGANIEPFVVMPTKVIIMVIGEKPLLSDTAILIIIALSIIAMASLLIRKYI